MLAKTYYNLRFGFDVISGLAGARTNLHMMQQTHKHSRWLIEKSDYRVCKTSLSSSLSNKDIFAADLKMEWGSAFVLHVLFLNTNAPASSDKMSPLPYRIRVWTSDHR